MPKHDENAMAITRHRAAHTALAGRLRGLQVHLSEKVLTDIAELSREIVNVCGETAAEALDAQSLLAGAKRSIDEANALLTMVEDRVGTLRSGVG